MKITDKKSFFSVALTIFLLSVSTLCQSADQNSPTPVRTNEISGNIRARDIGDARLTTHFYGFDGGQGDIFVNVVTRNFTGDIDVFSEDNLKPLSKIVIYADAEVTETGRLIYLRKGERLLLRVEGRTPNDDPATYQIKLGGSFIARSGRQADDAPAIAKTGGEDGPVRVNSVGTILPPVARPRSTEPARELPPAVVVQGSAKAVSQDEERPAAETTEREKSTADSATVFENKAAKVTVRKTTPPRKPPVRTKTTSKTANPPVAAKSMPAPEPKPDPLASINLVVLLKDGDIFQAPMSDVLRFNVNAGVLTITRKDGKVSRYSILDVEKVTIQ